MRTPSVGNARDRILESSKARRFAVQQGIEESLFLLVGGGVELRGWIGIEQAIGGIEHSRSVLRQFLGDPQTIAVGKHVAGANVCGWRRHQVCQVQLGGPGQEVPMNVGRESRRIGIDPLFLQPEFAPDEAAHRIDDQVELFTHDPPSGRDLPLFSQVRPLQRVQPVPRH